MKPVDPRLLRYARTTRAFLAASVALGLAGAGLVIAQAALLADVVVRAFQQHASPHDLRTPLLLLAATAAGRALVGWLTELAAHRSSAGVKSELRQRLLERATALGPGWLTTQRTGELAALATRGVDALDDYFARYLPQLALAVVVPAAVLARIVTADWISAAVVAGTLPLIPLFMALIGWATQAHTDRRWRLLARLSGHFLDVVAGLPTLKVFGRAKAQADNIRAITGDYRRATLRTLRIAFLSSLALELLATLSVALVAVGIGMRLVGGGLDLRTGLLVLVLAPEAYLPLRQVGAQYHAAAEGLSAADQVFAVLEEGDEERDGAGEQPDAAGQPRGDGSGAGSRMPAPDLRHTTVTVQGLCVRHAGRARPSLPPTDLVLRPGETVALTGPSGAGKTTLLHALLGFVRPADLAGGRILAGGTDLRALDLAGWHAQIAWVPQHPHLFAGTLADNVRLAAPGAADAAVGAALHAAGLAEADPATPLGEGGTGLSAGQRRRVALARAFLADRPLLLLDEPTAALDGETEAAVASALRRLARDRTVLLVTHRPALLAEADRVVRLDADDAPAVAPGGGAVSRAAAQAAQAAQAAPVTPVAAGAEGTGVASVSGAERGVERGAGVASVSGVEPEAGVASVSRAERRSARGAGVASVSGVEPWAERRSACGAGPGNAGAGSPVPRPGSGGARLLSAVGGRRVAPRLALALLLGSLALASAVGLTATSGWLISRASQQPPVLYLMVAVTATRAFGLGRAVLRYAERLVSHDTVLRLLADLRVTVYRRLERLAPAGLRRTRRGDLLSRLVADVDALQDHHLRWLLPAGTAAVVSAAATAFTASVLPAAGAALGAGLLVAGVAVPALTGAVARRTESQLAPARGRLATRTVDLLTGTGELAVAGALPARHAAVRDADAALTRLARRSAAATALGAGLTALAAGLTVTAAAWAGAGAVHDGRLAGVWLAVVVLTPTAAFEAVAGLPLAVQYRQRTRRSAARVREVLDAPAPVREPAADRAAAPPASPFPLTVRNLTVRHPDGRPGDAGERPPLADVDLALTAGRRVAVVGASGAGKTTLAQALLRFVDPVAGSYALGGVPAADLPSDAVRRMVGLCAQDAHIFDSTLRENLRLARPGGPDAGAGDGDGDRDLWDALAAARLDDWAATLPDGLDTLVGEHGARLSGGQRQRLALARALLADFPVLVLDEPAEHLDLPTADALTADLLALSADRTARGRATVLISHRLAGLAAVDEVVVLEAGRVVERGGFAELSAAGGPFARMLSRERAADARAAAGRPARTGVPAAVPRAA